MGKKYRFVTWAQDENNETQCYTIYEMPEEEFVKIEPANNTIFEVLRIEELFDMLVDNLFEFNKVVISYADKARLQTLYLGNSLQTRIDVNRTALISLQHLIYIKIFWKNILIVVSIEHFGILTRNFSVVSLCATIFNTLIFFLLYITFLISIVI